MGDNIPSQYVKLTREQDAVEISPGELNQPVHVPQLNVRTCPECGQQLPAGFEIPADEPWMTGICGCAQDHDSCKPLTSSHYMYPKFALASQDYSALVCCLAVILKDLGKKYLGQCICHAICIEGGITLAALISIFNGYIDPNTLRLLGEGLVFAWWICGIYNGFFREELQRKYHLQDSPCDPCVVHCCMHWCALCQEHREMKGRLPENTMTPMTVVNPPPMQEMTSEHKHESSSSLDNGDDHHRHAPHTGLEIQPV